MEQITPYLPGVAAVYVVVTLGLMSPGPNILSVIGASMSTGRRAGVMLALGVSTGTVIWATMTGAGLTMLLAAYASVLFVIKITGGLYLLWLGIKAFRSAACRSELRGTDLFGGEAQPLRYFVRGLTIQMSNPKAALTWIATMSLGMPSHAPWWVTAIIVAGSGLLSVVAHLTYAVAFSTPGVARAYMRIRRWIDLALGAFFSFAGIKLLTYRT